MKKTSAILAAFAVSFALQGEAFGAVQTKGQQKCINGMNKGMEKVGGLTVKAYSKCTTASANDDTTDADVCGANDEKIADAQAGLVEVAPTLCGEAPGFGYTGVGSVVGNAFTQARDLSVGTFGTGLGGLDGGLYECAVDEAGCKCQAAVFRATAKLFRARLKAYNTCKKDGLKDGSAPFDDATDLVACVTADPKLQVDKAKTKLALTITKSCDGVAAPFFSVASNCPNLTGANLATCLERSTLCRACAAETFSDGLPGVDGDIVDDGLDNSSCLPFE